MYSVTVSPGRHAEWAGSLVTRLLAVLSDDALVVVELADSDQRRCRARAEPATRRVHDHLGAELLDEFDDSGRAAASLRDDGTGGDRLGAHADT